MRIAYFIMCIVYSLWDANLSSQALSDELYYRKTNIVDQTCQFLEIILGIQQFGSMRELSIIIWNHRGGGQVGQKKLLQKIDDVRFATITASGVAAIPIVLFVGLNV